MLIAFMLVTYDNVLIMLIMLLILMLIMLIMTT